jgi:hypothetical protein
MLYLIGILKGYTSRNGHYVFITKPHDLHYYYYYHHHLLIQLWRPYEESEWLGTNRMGENPAGSQNLLCSWTRLEKSQGRPRSYPKSNEICLPELRGQTPVSAEI